MRPGLVNRSITPGPGSYVSRSTNEGLAFSIAGRVAARVPSQSPGPGTYRPNIRPTEEQSPSFGMGTSDRPPINARSKTPGPGTYSAQSPAKTSPQWTLKGKARRLVQKHTPGPGTYEVPGTRSAKAFSIYPRLPGVFDGKSEAPAPNAYSPVPVFPTVQISLGKAMRPGLSKTTAVPGPGSYSPKLVESEATPM